MVDTGLTLQAGSGAFGDGQHPTTRMLLQALHAMQGEAPARVLDVGCGSGILGLVAAQKWPCSVLATDIEATSIRMTQENAAANGLSSKVKALQTGDLQHPMVQNAAPFDLVMMNILSGPLLQLAHAASEVLAPGGVVMLSGMLQHEVGQIKAAYEGCDIAFMHQLGLQQWHALIGTRLVE